MMAVFDPYAERPWSTEEDKQLRNAVLQGNPPPPPPPFPLSPKIESGGRDTWEISITC